MKFIIGKKLGMARVFDTDGKSIAVTKVSVLPCIVSAIKTPEKDGYSSVQIKALKDTKDNAKTAMISEFRVEDISSYKVGDKVSIDKFQAGDIVEVTGTSKGKGFAGTIKRHGFQRGPESHGSNNVREPGSIGAQQPQRVILGRHMAGHMGSTTVTVKNLKVVDLDGNTILVSGAIPGSNKTLLKLVSKSSAKVEEVAAE